MVHLLRVRVAATTAAVLPTNEHRRSRRWNTGGRCGVLGIAVDNAPRDRFGFPNLEGHNVLVVDDHHDSAQFLAELLEFCGATVWTASSAAQARERLERRDFSLVICDFQMPRETGTQFMRWLRTRPDERASVAAAAVTAYQKEFLSTGDDVHAFDAYFVKPIDVPNFLRSIETILSRPRELKRA
jgi:CheY-like chemotaxis protein